jgi:hypothetical protein
MRGILSSRTLWVIVIPLLMGMGGLKEQKSPAEIPIPTNNYLGIVTDDSGVVTELTYITLDGRTFIVGHRGKATITIDFDKIEEATFVFTDQKLMATVKIRGGTAEKIYVDPTSRCSGRTGYGTFQIDARDIRVLRLKGTQKQ